MICNPNAGVRKVIFFFLRQPCLFDYILSMVAFVLIAPETYGLQSLKYLPSGRKCLPTPGPGLECAYELPADPAKMQIRSPEARGKAWESAFLTASGRCQNHCSLGHTWVCKGLGI